MATGAGLASLKPMHLAANLPLSRYEYAEQVARRMSGATVFDVGAGDGIMRQRIERAGCRWLGFDLLARNGVGAWDLHSPCPVVGMSADTVLLLDVIEHLIDPGLALDHITGALLRGGSLLITTPNPRWSRSRLWALRSGYLACFTQSDLDSNGHVFPVWPHVLERMLADRGFEIIEYVTLDGQAKWPKAPYTLRYLYRCAVAAAMMVIERADPTACGMSYGVIAKLK
jgi:2-polyprenyl-3-methyl-5-hydroxy-6-metoxy-1,4-benzoquinol methylase